MSRTEVAIILLASTACWLGLWAYHRLAIRLRWFDHPNERSSHVQPVPGGAGLVLAIVWAVTTLSSPVFFAVTREAMWLTGLGCLLAVLGWFDDRYKLSRRLRAVVILVVSIAAALVIDVAAIWALVITAGALFAFINAFNFMDGIDGIAGVEMAFVALAMAVLLPAGHTLLLPCLLLAGLSASFLCWNWAPATLFMGDAGSLFAGFLIASLIGLGAQDSAVGLQTSLLLPAVFVCDSAVALVMRLLNGENIFSAHRTHVYQLLARAWQSHQRVTLLVLVINVGILLPLAWLSAQKPALGTIILVSTYGVMCLVFAILRSHLLLSTEDQI